MVVKNVKLKKKFKKENTLTGLKRANGFSLIEVLFTLLVFSFGILSVVSIMTSSIRVSMTAKNQVIAAQLVQESLELVKNLNDNGVLVNGSNYSSYRIDENVAVSPAVIRFVSAGGAYRLYLDVNGFYSHTVSAQTTKFSRRVDISGAVAGQRTITSTVSWDGSGGFPASCNVSNKCVTAILVISY